MSNKQFKSALRRLRNGVHIFLKRSNRTHKSGAFKVQIRDGRFLGVIIVNTDIGDSFVDELWETETLDQLRRIACGYYPSLAKAFGPARNFVGA